MPHSVTLSEAKGLSRWAERCCVEFTLSVVNVLSMTVLSRLLRLRYLIMFRLLSPLMAILATPRHLFDLHQLHHL